MIHRADDAEIDATDLRWSDDPDRPSPVVVRAPIDDDDVRRIVEAFVSVRGDWDDIWLLASCVTRRRSTSSDRRSVSFPSSRFGEPGRVYLADGTEEPVDVGEGAALRFLARWLRVLVDGAPDEVTSHDEWADFVDDVEAIERDAAAAGTTTSDMTWTTAPDAAD